MSAESSATTDERSVSGSDSSSHHYNTRLSVRKSLSSGNTKQKEDTNSNSGEYPTIEPKKSLLSLFRRESSSSVEVEEEANSQFIRHSRTKFSAFREQSLSALREENEDQNSGDSAYKGVVNRKHSSAELVEGRQRRSSLLLECGYCNVRDRHQLVVYENQARMDPCILTSSRQSTKCSGIWPCILAIGAIIIIAIPLAKILGCMQKDITDMHSEMSGLKKQVGFVETGDPGNPVSKLSKECSEAIKYLVKEELGNFDSDKTGKTDFALESAGGRIVKTINTENYGSSVGFLGLTLCEGSNGPRAMIQANSAPGECWAFKGSKGAALIKLLGKVRISAVSLEHISSKVSPSGRLDTAPKGFSVYGLKDTKKPKVLLGKFEYKYNSDPIQTFPISSSCEEAYEYVEFHVESNHGSPQYTCVYRLRVHGTLDSL